MRASVLKRKIGQFSEKKIEENIAVTQDYPNTAELIVEECTKLQQLLLEKNQKYGDSAIRPIRIASKASAEEQILVRIDDKLSRLANSDGTDDEDVWKDLLGYILLLRVCRRVNGGIR